VLQDSKRKEVIKNYLIELLEALIIASPLHNDFVSSDREESITGNPRYIGICSGTLKVLITSHIAKSCQPKDYI
jgi:hypothetical protein